MDEDQPGRDHQTQPDADPVLLHGNTYQLPDEPAHKCSYLIRILIQCEMACIENMSLSFRQIHQYVYWGTAARLTLERMLDTGLSWIRIANESVHRQVTIFATFMRLSYPGDSTTTRKQVAHSFSICATMARQRIFLRE
ncbi:hypothetical protein [Paraburkholderia sediminicola]|uniref:hypothetical protein n=1 Tax=Paraburkholderia sediminicola TaxID=458836 RepID=UPI0038BAAC06